jgi:hypothetical protein
LFEFQRDHSAEIRRLERLLEGWYRLMDNFGEPRDSEPSNIMVQKSRDRRTVDPVYLGEKKDMEEEIAPRSRIAKL